MRYYYLFTIFLSFFSLFALLLKPISYDYFSWASMSTTIGASLIGMVAIISSILTGNENNRRNEMMDILNNILNRVELKKRTNYDKSNDDIIDQSKREILKRIDLNEPLKYAQNLIGIIGFYCFLCSALAAVIGWQYNYVLALFLFGISCAVGYILYLMDLFVNIDSSNIIAPINGKMNILSIKADDNYINFKEIGDDISINIDNVIKKFYFKITFNGNLKCGFIDTNVIYEDGRQSWIPDKNTYLMDFGFISDNVLAIFNGEDTGLLQGNISRQFDFDVIIKDEKINSNIIGKGNYPQFGEVDIYKNCTMPINVKIKEMIVGIYEDPLYKPNRKRRSVVLKKIIVNPK